MRVEHADGGPGYVVYSQLYGGGRDGYLVQLDGDYPGVAESLGWRLSRVQNQEGQVVHLSRRSRRGCQHESTDGTVNCPDCGVTALDFIEAAAEYLDRRAGGTA